jgi:hypothetical protein
VVLSIKPVAGRLRAVDEQTDALVLQERSAVMELPIKYINLTSIAESISFSSNIEGVRPMGIIRLIPLPTAV